MGNLDIYGGWLTVNRFCNFRCGWCYATGTEFKSEDNMPFETARVLVDFMHDIGVRNVILIGGETLFWPHLFSLATYIKSLGMKSAVVTNGWLLGFKKFRDRVERSDISTLSISLKGGNRKQYIELTGFDGFDKVMEGLSSVSEWKHIEIETSTVINTAVLNNIDEIVQVAFDNGASAINISMCGPSINNDVFDNKFVPEPENIVTVLEHKYANINGISGGNFSIEGTLPACLWSEEFLKILEDRGQISYGCHFKTRSGVIFDRWGNLIPCNHLFDYPLGKYGTDFTNAENFEKLWNSVNLIDFYDRMLEYPAKACISCGEFDKCGGGCPLNWFVRDPEKVIVRGGSS